MNEHYYLISEKSFPFLYDGKVNYAHYINYSHKFGDETSSYIKNISDNESYWKNVQSPKYVIHSDNNLNAWIYHWHPNSSKCFFNTFFLVQAGIVIKDNDYWHFHKFYTLKIRMSSLCDRNGVMRRFLAEAPPETTFQIDPVVKIGFKGEFGFETYLHFTEYSKDIGIVFAKLFFVDDIIVKNTSIEVFDGFESH